MNNIEQIQIAFDTGSGITATISGFLAWLLRDAPIAIFGVPFSVLLAGFAGAMAIVSFMPPFETRRKMWSTVAVCTLAAAYLTKLALLKLDLAADYMLGVSFAIGFCFQMIGNLIVQNSGKVFDAVMKKISGG